MTKWLVGAMVVLIVVAHVFLWRSGMPVEQKLTFTVLNVAGWTIVLAPIFLVGRWLKSVETRNAKAREESTGM
ncbi:MAG: hypothetical protein AAGA05_09095 [Pseudomonadota bacterium]